ncbi:MAG: CHAT domain-containing protein [Thermomonas sp.]|uniref:CHAT domain-containing protein n=1 Tax=Thermomonas sp. TaxID=1971895 RepID=UPI0025DCBF18|nr:CHAT domain-containing protein [Thermomonas sp.]MBK6924423.1 CHAT domain-containing protein [Thermomonas sp.]
MPRVAPTKLRFVPFLLASILLSTLLPVSPVRAACAPEPGSGLQESPPAASAQEAAPASDLPAPQAGDADADSEARAALAAISRLDDADTALALAADGAALYDREAVKLDGYAYCSQAVELAEKGEFRESARAASKALHVALQTGNKDLLGKAYRDLAIAFNYAGQLERAEQFANLALKYPGVNPTQVNGPARKVIGDVRTRQGRYDEAIASYEEARQGSSDRFRPLVEASLANALILSGDLVRARSTLDALAEPQEAKQRAQLQRTRGRLLLAENKPAEALALYQALASAPADGDEDFYRAWALDGMSKSQAALGNDAEAAQSLDQAIDVFDQARSQFRSDEFKMGLFSDLQNVFERAIGMHSKLGQPARAFDISERSRSRALLDAVAGRAELKGDGGKALDAASLQKMLRADEVVVAYHALPDRLMAWVLSSEGVREAAFPAALPRNDLARLVDAYRDALIKLNPNAAAIGDKIGQLLLAPLGVEAGKRVVIVPHGPLHYLPFQALRLDGQYLIERNPISIAPSISIAARLAERTPSVEAQLLAFGNPTIDPNVADPLPGAEREVHELSRQFPGAKLFFKDEANKANFTANAPQSRLVHIAAHATVDTLDPLHSKVLLADENGKPNYLEARDVIGMDLGNVAMIALSACESGLGRVENGDEVLGFTRSFLSAGTSTLLASLWPVSDAATEKLMTTLYAELAGGEQVQDAMRDAQRAVMADPETTHPFYWAPFNLIGNWRLKVAK